MEEKTSWFRVKNIQEGILFLVAGVALAGYGIGSFQSDFTAEWSQSPYLFPVIIAVGLLVLGSVILAQGVRQYRGAGAAKSGESGGENGVGVVIALLMTTAYYFLMRYITFVPATVVYLVGFMCYLGQRKIVPLAVISVAGAAVLYAVFQVLLKVPLP